MEERLDEALADAEKMARRVERVAESDPFAATLLAAEYLARVQERDVNPLEQRGRTDAWTSAFVRLRLMADKLGKDEALARDGKLYLAARAEERRLDLLLGPDAKSTLAKARDRIRLERRRRSMSFVFMALALLGSIALAGSVKLDVPLPVAGGGAALSLLVAVLLFLRASQMGETIAKALADATVIERGMSERAAFEVSPVGRVHLRALQERHPLLLRIGITAASSLPPGSERGSLAPPK